MKILILILFSILQAFDTSGNRALTDSIIKNPKKLISIENDTNYVIKDFNKYRKESLFEQHSEYIKKYFFNNNYMIERDTVEKVYTDIKDEYFIVNQIIYYNLKEDKYLQFGFEYQNQKWKMCFILQYGPDDDIFLKK